MPTLFSHPVAAVALAAFLKRRPSLALLMAGGLCSILPDADVAAFYFGISYGHPLGHRGFSHSLLFAVLLGGLAAWCWCRFIDSALPPRVLFVYFTLATASHGVLDALTDGGKGVGFFIPFDTGRYFFPWRPIRVSPIGASGFLERGGPVLISEFWWVWLPGLLLAVAGWLTPRRRRRRKASSAAHRRISP